MSWGKVADCSLCNLSFPIRQALITHHPDYPSRRGFLKVSAASVALVGLAATASGQESGSAANSS